MSLTLYYHPLSSFCWKALIALYDADIPFEPKMVDLSDPAERAAFQAVWPLAKFPVLRDEARGRTDAQNRQSSSTICRAVIRPLAGADPGRSGTRAAGPPPGPV